MMNDEARGSFRTLPKFFVSHVGEAQELCTSSRPTPLSLGRPANRILVVLRRVPLEKKYSWRMCDDECTETPKRFCVVLQRADCQVGAAQEPCSPSRAT